MKRLLYGLSIAMLGAYSVASGGRDGTIALSWAPAEGADVAGYRIYVGSASGKYDHPGSPFEVGQVTHYEITGLVDCREYFIAVTTRNAQGNEFVPYSDEMSGWPAPRVEGMDWRAGAGDPVRREGVLAYTVRLLGANFRNGTVVTVQAPLGATNVDVKGCDRLQFELRVPEQTAFGNYDVTVRNPDGSVGRGSLTIGPVPGLTRPTATAGENRPAGN